MIIATTERETNPSEETKSAKCSSFRGESVISKTDSLLRLFDMTAGFRVLRKFLAFDIAACVVINVIIVYTSWIVDRNEIGDRIA